MRKVGDGDSDRWEPEPWSRTFEQPAPRPVPAPVERVRPPVRRPAPFVDRDRRILGIAVTNAVTAVVAFGASLIPFFQDPDGWPWLVAIVVVAMIVGVVVSRDEGATLFTRGWISNLVTTAAIMPIAALAVTLARQPHVALSAGSAWAPMLFTFLICLIMTAMAAAFAIWSADEPDEAALLVLPAAMIIPAIIGLRGGIEELQAVRALGQAAIIAAGAAVMAWSLAPALRAFVPPLALGLQVVLLWLSGQGPSFSRSSGEIVPLLFSALFAASVLMVVATSILAILARQFERDSRPFGRELYTEPERFRPSRRPPLR
ncbi:MAG: hypothetical protein IT334_07480 [Thermomicrobiales bacterium]|nr:hypothetical protein [Thermomicrobiales bacterium]